MRKSVFYSLIEMVKYEVCNKATLGYQETDSLSKVMHIDYISFHFQRL